jgi:hypothetical protein
MPSDPLNECDGPSAPNVEARPSAPVSHSGTAHGLRLVFAWVVSIAVHVGLFGTMFAVPWIARAVVGSHELTVAQTDLVVDPQPARTMLLAPEPQLNEAGATPVSSAQVRFAPKKSAVTATVGQPERRELSILGLGAGGSDFGRYGLGVGGGDTAPQFFGLGGTARGATRIVYVVDRSGSMTGTFGAVRDELKQSVERLRRSMRFHVIFFNAGAPLENTPKDLVHASREEKTALADFLDTVQPQGNTDPLPAMRRAFALNPEVIYLLTDGEFDPKLVEELRKWNSKKQVRIFTIAYVSQGGAALLEQIAREHNGQYRFVSEHDL